MHVNTFFWGFYQHINFSETQICSFIQNYFKKILQQRIWFIYSLPGKYQALFINRDILDGRLRSYSATVPSPVCKSHCLSLSEKLRTERLHLCLLYRHGRERESSNTSTTCSVGTAGEFLPTSSVLKEVSF